MTRDILVYWWNEDDVRISVDEYGYSDILVYAVTDETILVETSVGISDTMGFLSVLRR